MFRNANHIRGAGEGISPVNALETPYVDLRERGEAGDIWQRAHYGLITTVSTYATLNIFNNL